MKGSSTALQTKSRLVDLAGARTDDEGVCSFLQCCPDSGNNNDNTLTPFAQIDLDEEYC